MKYEKESTTKDGRRTWKVTYELVRGPEPKPKRNAEKATKGEASKKTDKNEARQAPAANSQPNKPAPSQGRGNKGKAKGSGSQLGMF